MVLDFIKKNKYLIKITIIVILIVLTLYLINNYFSQESSQEVFQDTSSAVLKPIQWWKLVNGINRETYSNVELLKKDNKIVIPSISQKDIDNMTISFWAKVSPTSENISIPPFKFISDMSINTVGGFDIKYSNSMLSLLTKTELGINKEVSGNIQDIDLKEWNNYVFIISKSDRGNSIYINGNSIQYDKLDNFTIKQRLFKPEISSNDELKTILGDLKNEAGNIEMYDLRIYNRELSDNEIDSLNISYYNPTQFKGIYAPTTIKNLGWNELDNEYKLNQISIGKFKMYGINNTADTIQRGRYIRDKTDENNKMWMLINNSQDEKLVHVDLKDDNEYYVVKVNNQVYDNNGNQVSKLSKSSVIPPITDNISNANNARDNTDLEITINSITKFQNKLWISTNYGVYYIDLTLHPDDRKWTKNNDTINSKIIGFENGEMSELYLIDGKRNIMQYIRDDETGDLKWINISNNDINIRNIAISNNKVWGIQFNSILVYDKLNKVWETFTDNIKEISDVFYDTLNNNLYILDIENRIWYKKVDDTPSEIIEVAVNDIEDDIKDIKNKANDIDNKIVKEKVKIPCSQLSNYPDKCRENDNNCEYLVSNMLEEYKKNELVASSISPYIRYNQGVCLSESNRNIDLCFPRKERENCDGVDKCIWDSIENKCYHKEHMPEGKTKENIRTNDTIVLDFSKMGLENANLTKMQNEYESKLNEYGELQQQFNEITNKVVKDQQELEEKIVKHINEGFVNSRINPNLQYNN